ncbi:hypothetical protein F5Y16DRAFT_403760 [Xylariaceae sp. FL0255]|nr:hypothetical protein F5Y16DRAFT_403760 [Xylariaceae sp. FL0255]
MSEKGDSYFVTLLVVSAAATIRPPHIRGCPTWNKGAISISDYQLYPENLKFDERSRLLYLSSLFNASLMAYDPYSSTVVKALTIPGITESGIYHLSGIDASTDSESNDLITFIVDAGAAFDTSGQDISGDNSLIRYMTSRAASTSIYGP